MGAVMTGIGAFISLILSVLFGMEKMRANKAGGMVLGLMGIAWMNAAGAGFGLGEWLLLVSQVFGALAAVLASLVSRRHDILLVSAWQFVFGGLLLALPGFAMGGRLWSNDVLAWLNLAYLSFVSATAYTLYNWLLSKHPVSSVAVWTCLIPIAGVFWSWILLGEDAFLSWTTFPSVLLVVAGVWLVNKKTAR
jgi:drug/metabolite transporter (DMT)-like permease